MNETTPAHSGGQDDLSHFTADFDPYHIMLHSNGARARLWVPGLIAAVMVAVLLLVNAAQGTLGGRSDLRIPTDARRPFTAVHSYSPPSFPLARDVVSWILLLSVISGLLLLHREWQLMKECIPNLVKNGALLPRDPVYLDDDELELDVEATYELDWLSRRMGVDRMIKSALPGEAMDTLLRRMKRFLTHRVKPFLIAGVLLVSIVCAYALMNGQHRGLFTGFAPADYTGSQLRNWLTQAYSGWWAGPDHFAGQTLYLIYAIFAFIIIAAFNVIGIIALYLVVALQYVSKPSADWLNRDGRYGWQPLAAVFRTVLAAVGLLGVTLAVTLTSIGLQNLPWIGPVVAVYVLYAPLFVGVPAWIFRTTEKTAKRARVEELFEAANQLSSIDLTMLSARAAAIAEIERTRKADFRPLRLWSASNAAFVSVWILPIVLTIIQIRDAT